MSPPRCFRYLRKLSIGAIFGAIILSFSPAISVHAAPGEVISNQATVDFLNAADLQRVIASNTIDVVTGVLPSDASIDLTRVVGVGSQTFQETVGPSACLQGGGFTNLPDPVLVGGVQIDPTQPQNVSTTASYNLGEPVFIRLNDTDQNVNATVIDYAVVTVSSSSSGDSEIIRLAETGVDTGIFSGYIPTMNGGAVIGDCVLQSATNSVLTVRYTDPADPSDTTEVSAQFDPVSRVFESRTGTAISGSVIELVDAVSGLPATVFGNDGISDFPSVITSGGNVVDSGGTSYQFGPGEYRFPVVANGSYRLLVTPSPDYAAPSTASIQDLQLLPNAPFMLGTASFGDSFVKSGELSFEIDIPLDPQSSALFLQKTTLTTVAAPGDFVRYELIVENTSSSGVASNVFIVDQLPGGVRYVTGSVANDSGSLPDPVIDMNNATLTFNIGDLDVAGRTQIFYLVEIISGERNQELVNSATAFAGNGLISNQADARIILTEDLFRSTSTLIGRVVEGECSAESYAEDQGVEGVRIYLEDGRYAVSDQGGRFHFEGLKPGSHVAQIDTESVADYFDIVGCDTSLAFGGRTESQLVRLSRGNLTRADFYLRRKMAPEGQVDIELQNVGTDSSEQVAYILRVNGQGNVSISNLSVMLLMPPGVEYIPGTLTVGGKQGVEPRIAGPSLIFTLPEQNGNWTQELRFTARIGSATHGELATKAFARFDSPIESAQQTPIVDTRMIRERAIAENAGYVLNLNFAVLSNELSPSDQLELGVLIEDWKGVSDINIQAIGHSDSDRISKAKRHLFANNYVLSEARARAAAGFIAQALNIPAANIQVEGRGPSDPVASNKTRAGKQKNRRVEMVLSGVRPRKPSFLNVTQASSGTRIAATKGAVPGLDDKRQLSILEQSRTSAVSELGAQYEPPIASLLPGTELLVPAEDFVPALPVTRISVKHAPDQRVRVLLNGIAVSALNFDGIVTNAQKTFALSRWAGVDLQDGENQLRAIVENADGSIAATFERTLNFAGAPIRGEIVPELSLLVADGKTRPIVAVRLFDRTGHRSRRGTMGTFRIDSPYRSWWEVEDERKNDIVAIGNREPRYRVEEEGIALIELAPTTHSGEATIHLQFENNRQQDMRIWLNAEPRDWILVGFAEGTVGYNTLRDNQTAALSAGNKDGYYDDGRVAFFAKGSVKGKFLLTLAYDSARDRDESRNQFETIIDPNANYPLYADKSEQRFEAASQRKLYIKLEKRQFFALFGDFNTGLSYTELARYERRFNGFKSEYRGERIGYSAFASETDQSFVRDEMQGDGTSGLYRLSSTPIIGNSDLIRIEVRDRFDTGHVLSSTTLTRYLDYNLDTQKGTLYFKKPVPSRDQNFNPIYIVAEYESFSDANEGVVAGGRASLHFEGNTVELGVTHINDGQQGSEADLTGVDLRWQVTSETEIRAEIAASNRDDLGSEESGSAYAAYIEHQSENIDLRAYVKEVEQGFGLGSQSAAETGIRKVGIDGRMKFKERFYLDGEATWQQNLVTETIRGTARGRIRYENGGFNALTGIVHAEDEFEDGETFTSDLAEIGLSQRIGDITLRANSSFALSSSAENIDFPTSMVFGADFRVLQGVEIFAEYEDASGRDIDAQMSRLGVRATPWHRGQINTSFTNQTTEFGPRLFANVGLVQGFQLNDRWVLDFGVDSTKTLIEADARVFDPDRELVSGSFNEDFAAYFAGATYNAKLWSANGRVEVRNSDTEDRIGLLAGWYREPSLGHSMSAGLALLDSKSDFGDERLTAALKYGWAWRKADSRWSFLNRIDVIFEELRLNSQTQENHRFINNFNANRRISERSQLSLQYAFKYVRGTFDDLTVSGYTDLIGADYRHGFHPRWDAGIHTSIYTSHRSSTTDYGLGLDVAFNLRANLWVTLGYNLSGFHDSDFSEARYTAQGPFLRLTIKADQHTLKRIAGNR